MTKRTLTPFEKAQISADYKAAEGRKFRNVEVTVADETDENGNPIVAIGGNVPDEPDFIRDGYQLWVPNGPRSGR